MAVVHLCQASPEAPWSAVEVEAEARTWLEQSSSSGLSPGASALAVRCACLLLGMCSADSPTLEALAVRVQEGALPHLWHGRASTRRLSSLLLEQSTTDGGSCSALLGAILDRIERHRSTTHVADVDESLEALRLGWQMLCKEPHAGATAIARLFRVAPASGLRLMEMGAPPRVAVHVVPVLCGAWNASALRKRSCSVSQRPCRVDGADDALRHGERPGEEVDVERALELLPALPSASDAARLEAAVVKLLALRATSFWPFLRALVSVGGGPNHNVPRPWKRWSLMPCAHPPTEQ